MRSAMPNQDPPEYVVRWPELAILPGQSEATHRLCVILRRHIPPQVFSIPVVRRKGDGPGVSPFDRPIKDPMPEPRGSGMGESEKDPWKERAAAESGLFAALDAGADPNAWVSEPRRSSVPLQCVRALNAALWAGFSDAAILRLLRAGADPKLSSVLETDAYTLCNGLGRMAAARSVAVARAIGDAGLDWSACAPSPHDLKGTPLGAAARHGQLETLDYLLAVGMDPNARAAPLKIHPLFEALRGEVSPRVFASMARLLQAGADPRHPFSTGNERSPALDAGHRLWPQAYGLLVRSGAPAISSHDLASCDNGGAEAPPLLIHWSAQASGATDAGFALMERQRQAQAEAKELAKRFSEPMAGLVAGCVEAWPTRSALMGDLGSWPARLEKKALLAEINIAPSMKKPLQGSGRRL